jgi:hypothetical protein
MRSQISAVAILITGMAGPALAQQPPSPGYCIDFPPAACARMTAVIESKTRPAYCKPGPVPTSRGAPLTTEQLRICYTMQDPAPPGPSLATGSPGGNEQKLAEDSRAMVRRTWATYGQSIKDTEIALRCNLVDQFAATLAIRNVQNTMHDLLLRAGLFGETELNIDRETERFVQTGQRAVQDGACTSMTPLARDQLRQAVLGLARR